MKKYFWHLFICGIAVLSSELCWAQVQHLVWIGFHNKEGNSYQIQNPEAFLSQRSIDRKARHHITIDSLDLPITAAYIDSLTRTTLGSERLRSRWLNGIILSTNDTTELSNIRTWDFIKEVLWITSHNNGWPYVKDYRNNEMTNVAQATPIDFTSNYYASAWRQINMHRGQYLHEQGLEGQNKWIAIIDAGFEGLDNNRFFDYLVQNNNIIDQFNFLRGNADFSQTGSHGTNVLSTIAAFVPNEFVGVAPKAQFALYHTDDEITESYYEVYAYIAALERADSIGIDIVNSSLGYNYFDEARFNYSISELDGNTTILTKAVNKAVEKGMVIVTSAGNEGNRPWRYVLFPSDAISSITVGNVNYDSTRNSSSGIGSASLSKPDVMGMGSAARTVNNLGNIIPSSGTSIATPIITGLLACYMQAFPELTPLQIKEALLLSSHKRPSDNIAYYGYGIPNFQKMYEKALSIAPNEPTPNVVLYPNPFSNHLHVIAPFFGNAQISIYTISGHPILSETFHTPTLNYNTSHWASGLYMVLLQQGDVTYTFTVFKQ